MGYHPETLVCSWPPMPRDAFQRPPSTRWSIGRLLYWASPIIGFDVWHNDPQHRSDGQRTDDSCGWFDRRPREYGEAVQYLLTDEATVHEINRILSRRTVEPAAYSSGSYPQLAAGDLLALCLLIARELEMRRWWNGKRGACTSLWRRVLTRRRDVFETAVDLALNPLDNLGTVDSPEAVVGLIAGALHRRFKPWWRHPRWHVHHWQVNFNVVRNTRRMFERCATCRKPLGFGYCPVSDGQGLHHMACRGICSGSVFAQKEPAE